MDEILDNRAPEIPCHEVLYRAVLSKRHISADGRVAADVFFLRPSDELVCYRFSEKNWFQWLLLIRSSPSLKPPPVTLHTGRVRDAGTVLTPEHRRRTR